MFGILQLEMAVTMKKEIMMRMKTMTILAVRRKKAKQRAVKTKKRTASLATKTSGGLEKHSERRSSKLNKS